MIEFFEIPSEEELDRELFLLSPEDEALIFGSSPSETKINLKKLDFFCETILHMYKISSLRGNQLAIDFDEKTAIGKLILTCSDGIGSEEISRQVLLSTLNNMDSVEIRSENGKITISCFVQF